MVTKQNEAKQVQIIITTNQQLKTDFRRACKAGDITMSKAIRTFVKAVAAGQIVFNGEIKIKKDK
jgi:antitoxin component of RelBE/YafQ-DinJ toxin-antitoxin module